MRRGTRFKKTRRIVRRLLGVRKFVSGFPARGFADH